MGKRDIQSGNSNEQLPLISASWDNGNSLITWTTLSAFQGMSELQGDILALRFAKAVFICFHAILQHNPTMRAFWAWHLCFQWREANAQIHTGVPVVKHVSGKLSVQKKCGLRALFWELEATLAAAQCGESKQDQIGQLDAEASGKTSAPNFLWIL